MDVALEIDLERIILASKVIKQDGDRISEKLFESMYDKKIPGFCEALENAMKKTWDRLPWNNIQQAGIAS